MIALTIVIIACIVGIAIYRNKQKKIKEYLLPASATQLLQANVAFYRELNEKDKQLFEQRIKDFLARTRITGVDVVVEDIDRILIASGAIIPIFSFPDWRYNNIDEVLLYKDSFNKEYKTEGQQERNILGMVGDGAMQREMILSQPALRSSFSQPTDGYNSVIHEFVHLIDKADGSVDGIPEYLLSRPYIIPWVKNMHDTINKMRAEGHSDINLYGATNDAEFFAVISEYFFERPNELKLHHPELYSLLEKMFNAHTDV